MGVSAVTSKLAKPTGITKTRSSPRRGSLNIYRTRSRAQRLFHYTDLDGVTRVVQFNGNAVQQVNDYTLDPSDWTSEPYPFTFPLGRVWPPRHIDHLMFTTDIEAIDCVGPTCFNNVNDYRCKSPTCKHTLSAWKTATSDWEEHFELRATPDRGIGAYTKRAFRAGTILGWYTGELKTPDTTPPFTNWYLMDMNIGDVEPSTDDELVPMCQIDGERKANWTRFINHSCEADCVFRLKRVGRIRIMAVEAVKDIGAGQELSVDYGPDYYGLKSWHRCGCGASTCVEKKRRRLERLKKRKERRDEGESRGTK